MILLFLYVTLYIEFLLSYNEDILLLIYYDSQMKIRYLLTMDIPVIDPQDLSEATNVVDKLREVRIDISAKYKRKVYANRML